MARPYTCPNWINIYFLKLDQALFVKSCKDEPNVLFCIKSYLYSEYARVFYFICQSFLK